MSWFDNEDLLDALDDPWDPYGFFDDDDKLFFDELNDFEDDEDYDDLDEFDDDDDFDDEFDEDEEALYELYGGPDMLDVQDLTEDDAEAAYVTDQALFEEFVDAEPSTHRKKRGFFARLLDL